jgi:hypothetical protein
MLSINQNFDESRSIKVLVVPIGDNSLFDSQFEIVSRRKSVQLFDMNNPYYSESPFKNLNWNAGSLLFDYLRYDRVASAHGDLDTFQCGRRFTYVIGLINYPELEGSKTRLVDDMEYYSRRCPHVILKQYFVFNMFDRPNVDSSTIPFIPNDPSAVVVFPPDGECEGGMRMIDVHLQEVMAGVALKILLALESQAAACEEARAKSALKIPPGFNIITIFDEYDDDSKSGSVPQSTSGVINLANISSKMKKKVPGRLRKIVGDLCLQVIHNFYFCFLYSL